MQIVSALASKDSTIRAFLRKANQSCHRVIASSEFLARFYFSVIPFIARRCRSRVQRRLLDGVKKVVWPNIRLRPHRIILGKHTEVLLHPHFEEFDLEAALSRRLSYEEEVFVFLESRMNMYDCVVEVGAN